MVFGFGDAFDSQFCVDNNDGDFLEKRIFRRNFVANFGNIFYDNESTSVDNLCTSNGNWWVKFVGGENW